MAPRRGGGVARGAGCRLRPRPRPRDGGVGVARGQLVPGRTRRRGAAAGQPGQADAAHARPGAPLPTHRGARAGAARARRGRVAAGACRRDDVCRHRRAARPGVHRWRVPVTVWTTRRATAADAAAVVGLRALMFSAMGVPGVEDPGWQAAATAWFERELDGGRACVVVAEDADGEVVAGAMAGL